MAKDTLPGAPIESAGPSPVAQLFGTFQSEAAEPLRSCAVEQPPPSLFMCSAVQPASKVVDRLPLLPDRRADVSSSVPADDNLRALNEQRQRLGVPLLSWSIVGSSGS